MNIKGTIVLVLGGGGMVGRAVCRELLLEEPAKIVVCSLAEAEARRTVQELEEESQRRATLEGRSQLATELVAEWGNIFVREELHHMSTDRITATAEGRRVLLHDTFEPLDQEILELNYLYRLVERHRPAVIVDAINTATAIAYSDVFTQARRMMSELYEPEGGSPSRESLERMLCSLYIPQLIRHVEILYRAMSHFETGCYVKIGTSGTGGMGWNIPYTHGEERPSLLLLSKSAVAGAHTLLLFLQARTPSLPPLEPDPDYTPPRHPPTIKEIKPTAAIAWREIGYGDVLRRGEPILLEDVSMEDAAALQPGGRLALEDPARGRTTGERLRTVYVDSGENGMFSVEEFVAITSPGQMLFVTPEEIARHVVDEILGVNTGKDVITALNVACMGPTYRAGYQRERVIRRLRELERIHNTASVAFEILGPPRLSKLLYEAYLLRRCFATMQAVMRTSPEELSLSCRRVLEQDRGLLRTIVTLGIPVLIEDGEGLKLVRGRCVKTPTFGGINEVQVTSPRLEEWAAAGWVDLRVQNMEVWRSRFRKIVADVESIPRTDTSSRYVRGRDFWGPAEGGAWEINPGEIAAWIFTNEDRGERGRE